MTSFSDWLQSRLGKFTASEINKLMGGGKRPMTEAELGAREKGSRKTTVDTLFGDGAMTYIHQKVAETLTQEPVTEFNANATDYGNAMEPEAANAYRDKHPDYTVIYYGGVDPVFFPYGDFAGGSPDALVNEDGMAEIKCPYNSTKHVEFLLVQTQEQFKEENTPYYDQIQMNLLVTERKWCDIVFFNPRMTQQHLQLVELRIERDEERISEIKYRIEAATEILADLLKQISERK